MLRIERIVRIPGKTERREPTPFQELPVTIENT